jgi:hypothetical protein
MSTAALERSEEHAMQVRYVGPSGSGVDVVHPDPAGPDANTVTHCPPGETVDLPNQQAESLIAAGVFEAVTGAPRRRSPRERHSGPDAVTTDEPEEG